MSSCLCFEWNVKDVIIKTLWHSQPEKYIHIIHERSIVVSCPCILLMYFYYKHYAGFRLTCRLPHCRFDDDISSTAQASLAAEGWPSGKQRQANRSITLPLCPSRQIADSWILFNSGAIAALWKAKAVLPLRAATLKQQAMITRRSGKAASGKLVWNQHYVITHESVEITSEPFFVFK